MGDNVGGGSPGDGTLIARAIQARGGPKAFVALWDAEASAKAFAAGVGARLTLKMGGKSQAVYAPPLEATVTVQSLHEGKFEETKVRHGGMRHFDMGPTAIVRTDAGLFVQLMTRRVFPTSLVQITSCGLDPTTFGILIAKGVQAPVAAYAPVCVKLIRVNTPGVTDADMRRLTFKNRRRPLFPFEAI
ncbi:MAG: MlrC C-terminal domain-containing protein [Planctomycetota bacterium]|nr:MlrC C-terminal domain-containing protein [Planctomycetota bacterium]